MIRLLIQFICLISLGACSYVPSLDDVLPDKRSEYKKSEALPDLEIPPDLTADARNDAMNIPGEETVTLSQYKRQQSGTDVYADKNASTLQDLSGEQWISVRGSSIDIWEKLGKFFKEKGHSLELDDAELGVLVTNWSEPMTEGGFVYRNKFKVFSEPGAESGVTVLFVSNSRQEQVSSDSGGSQWIDQGKSTEVEKQLTGELNQYFNSVMDSKSFAEIGVDTSENTVSTTTVSKKQAEVLSAGEGKSYLAIPEEFSMAWRQTERALQTAGIIIENKNQDNGIYFIRYYNSEVTENKGWLTKLAFWKGDENSGIPYQISLTGVGDKTELIVLNEGGDWDTGDNAKRILALLQNQYNQ